MKIDDAQGLFPQTRNQHPGSGTEAATAAGMSFAEMMAQSVASDGDGDDGTGTGKSGSAAASALDIIKDQGFSAYAEQLRAKKMAELRAKILDRMGLSEEDLQKMSPQQRATIEELIAREIQQRMAATSDDGDDKKGTGGDAQPKAAMIADSSGTGGAGMALLAALEARDATQPADPAAADGRNHLPGDTE